MTIKLHLVWNEAHNECVGFIDFNDAYQCATGHFNPNRSTLGDGFFEMYGDDAPLAMETLDLETEDD